MGKPVQLSAKEEMATVRFLWIKEKEPFFGQKAYQLTLTEDENVRTGYTDGRLLAFNPAMIHAMTKGQRDTFAYHEVRHFTDQDHLRRGERDPIIWNMAGDYVINLAAVKNNYEPIVNVRYVWRGKEIVLNWLYDERFKGLCKEEVYAILKKEGNDPRGRTDPKGEGKGGNGQSEDKQGSGEQGDSDSPAQNNDQQHVGENGQRRQDEVDFDGNIGGVRDMKREDGTPMSEGEKDAQSAKEIADNRVFEAIARQQGKGTGHMKEVLDAVMQPVVHWEAVLQRFATSRARDDYNMGRPSKRGIAMGIISPSLDSPTLGTILAFTDSSGSVDRKKYTSFYSELYSVKATYKDTRIIWVQVDDGVTDVREIELDGEMPEIVGRGGTDYRPAFKWAETELDEQPVCSLYFTDGQCNSFPGHEPEWPHLWVLDHKLSNWKPPFGEVVWME